jgi:two-component system sensor histidine kinase KdpD
VPSAPYQVVGRWTTAALLLAAIVCAYRFLAPANNTTVALTLLLLVLVLARWGLRYAVVTSIAASVCYNFFFLPPRGTFTIADPQNWLTLFAFLATAVVGSRLAEQARREATQARVRQQELEVLYRLSRELLQAEDVASLLTSIAPAAMHTSGATAAALLLSDGRLFQAIEREYASLDESLLEQARTHMAGLPSSTDWLLPGVRAIPLRAGVRPRGLLLLRGVAFSLETLDALGGLVSVSIDRAQALEEVTYTRTLQESERMRRVMIDALTHELRTPLTAIKAAATTLLAPHEIAREDRIELLQIIDEEADRLNRLVARAVEVTQLEAHEAQMTFLPVAPVAIAHAALEQSAGALGRHRFVLQVSEALPRLLADATYLAKVLSNLLENAAKYSRPGTVITLEAHSFSNVVVFAVKDAGIGIDPFEHSLIFAPLYRARTQTDTVSGTGMGLAISRSIAEAHGGSLQVESAPGSGSTFRLTVPVLASPLQSG